MATLALRGRPLRWRRLSCSTNTRIPPRPVCVTRTRRAAKASVADEFPSGASNPTNVDGSDKAAMSDKPYSEQVVLIVGKGRVGKALDKMAESLQYFHAVLVRNDILTPNAQRDGPIYLATHASDLDDALTKIHSNRKNDLVLLQGGLLRLAWLAERGLEEATQVALYASANDLGDIKDGGGSTVVTGPYAKHVVGMMEAGGVACTEVDKEKFEEVAFQKLLWTSIFWLLCHAEGVGGSTVGEIIEDPTGLELVRELANELIDVAVAAGETRAGYDEELRETVFEGLLKYSRAIPQATPSLPMALKEGAFRNGWFLAVGSTSAQPKHIDLLTRAGVDLDELTAAGKREHGL